jgi:hypothetical protein
MYKASMPRSNLPFFIALVLCFLGLVKHPVSASPDGVVVFNEIQYNPAGSDESGEWIELFNQMGIITDISGWQIDGIGYTFPDGTLVNPGSYVVVAKTPGAGEFGPFTGSIDNGGERLRLYNQSDRLMDELDFGDDARWPAAADGSGATLAKRKQYTASGRTDRWTYSEQLEGTRASTNFPDSGGPPPSSTLGLIALSDVWRYKDTLADPGADWAANAHPLGGDWKSGAGGIGFESGPTISLGTMLSHPNSNSPYVVTYHYEREFSLSAAQFAGLQSLKLRHGFDDGAVIYLNGTEVLRVNMPAGVIDASTLALGGLEIDTLSADTTLPTAALVSGSNRISIEVHQEGLGSSDTVFGAELDVEIAGVDPGAGPVLSFNEVPPATEASFWVELINNGPADIELAGIIISAGADPLREHPLAAGPLAPGALLLIDEATLGFRPADGEKLFLFDAAETAVLDARQVTGRLLGRAEERNGAWLSPNTATPGLPNVFAFNDDVVISEIAYSPPGLGGSPGVPPTFEITPLAVMGGSWRYNDADVNLPSDWATAEHPAGGDWKTGTGPIGFESGTLPVPLSTVLSPYRSSTVTYYYETDFTVSSEVFNTAESLELTHQIDDGAAFYLNGVRVGEFNLPSGPLSPETLANPSVPNAAIGTLQIPVSSLMTGVNRLSVEVHQSSTGSSDTVFGVGLDARVQTSPGIPALPFRNSDNQWIEIANRGANAIDLGGWDFDNGIAFNFPAGTMLASGEHACLARDSALFTAAFPGARLLGEFSGSLSRTSEHILLRDANRNPVDELRYFDGGRWPKAADGGGSTLELRDLDADNRDAVAWAASDESSRTAWKTYTYRETAASSRGPDNQWREFNMGLLSDGEILIDDISVIENPDGSAVQKLSDTTFDNPAAWKLVGNHRHGEIIDDPDSPGNKVLRIVATGATEHMHNQIFTKLPSAISNGTDYEISFRARWVSGSRQLHTRLYFNRCANVNFIERPEDVGTPSAPNSRAEVNIGPTYTGMKHSPVVPSAGEPTTVSITANDPDGISSLTLFYSVNGGAFQTVAMGGGVGGLYSGEVPGQSSGARVQFYLTGADSLGATQTFPQAGPDSRAMYQVNDGLAATNRWQNFRIIMTAADSSFQHQSIQVMSNDRLGATIIDREGDIYYGCGVRLKSSQRGRANLNRVGYSVRFPSDGLYRGALDSVAIDRSESQSPGQRELLFDIMIANSGGVISRYYDFVKVLAPNSRLTGGGLLQMARYGDVFLDSQFDDGGDGQLYEYELIYYPTSEDSNGFKRPQPDSVTGSTVSNLGDDPELYRWFFLNKNNREADNLEPIMAYNKHFSKSGASFDAGLEEIVDVDSWFRGMAYAVLSGAGDNAGSGSQHNGMYYARPDGRVMFLPHDMDFGAAGGNPTASIFANRECNKLASVPTRRRIYFGILHDIVTTTWNSTYMSDYTTHLASLDPSQNWAGKLNSFDQRRNYVLTQINNSIAPINFSLTTSSPQTVSSSTATISGEGWVNVREIRLTGGADPLAVEWTDGDSWTANIPVAPGSHPYTVEAYDFSGVLIASDTITIDNNGTVEPASPLNLAVSELMYNPSDPTAAEANAGFTDADLFEFIELANIGTLDVDLRGVSFTAGINYDLPAIIIQTGERVVLVRNRPAFLARHPGASAFLLPGEYGIGDSNQLANGGEQLVIEDALGGDIRRFTYDDNLPWPSASDSNGPSLVLISPDTNPDHTLPENWRPSTAPGGNPGSSDATSFVGDPNADLDNNGVRDLVDHALLGNGLPVLSLSGTTVGLEHDRNLAADDVIVGIQISTDLSTWTDGSGLFSELEPIYLGAGGQRIRYEAERTELPAGRFFTRLKVTLAE